MLSKRVLALGMEALLVQNANFVTLFSKIYIFYPFLKFYFSSTTPFTTKDTETSKDSTGIIVTSTVLTLVTIIMVVLAGIMFSKRMYVQIMHVWNCFFNYLTPFNINYQ